LPRQDTGEEVGELIRACRWAFEGTSRQLNEDARDAFRIRLTPFIRVFQLLRRDPLRAILRDQDVLWRHGQVVWGYVVQANERLFSPRNRWTLPAVVIYSTDPYFDNEIALLEAMAEELLDLRGVVPRDKQWRPIAKVMNDELARAGRLQVPSKLCGSRIVYFTTCLIHPAHLPGEALGRPFVPLVICPRETDSVMVLPCDYWPTALRQTWESD
jgi:hypothetical protein